MATHIQELGSVREQKALGRGLHLLKIEAPQIASLACPGQFIHLKIPGMEAHILRRPFSLYAADAQTGIVEVLYQVVGFGTRHLTSIDAGSSLDLIGPVGNTWSIPKPAQRVLLVGGGVGAAPLFMLAQHCTARNISLDVVIGAQTEESLVCYKRYESLLQGIVETEATLHCSTDDGSFGHAGFCTDIVAALIEENTYEYAAVCGPEPMMKSAVRVLETHPEIMTEVSLEKRMACGVGACLSCVCETKGGLKRSCVDGPIFSASEVVFA